ncbi:TonB-dependent receptor [Erythrobacter sp. YJ-T3-07]|uniref:TonB-dependent receptor n=1 Tax=Erythrobacter sp. YJ-T3-07 TaxID=2793063 RepID=UPI0018D3B1C8|nr:TonB-dependent receptor [Erythrobacter sp. YJ-T3-07]MBH1945028.1 TonB-dependent receptor [Erythrobacter sp. YJ-T3-07]
MKRFFACSSLALATSLLAVPAAAQDSGTEDDQATGQAEVETEVDSGGLATIVVTAQRRESSVQDSSVAISAFSGESLDTGRVLSFEDLAGSATSLSFTALSPLDQEFNIRGITNTRLDSPSADQSIGIFVDDVYVGRSGLFNFDLFDIDRVEVVRGPQGVLLGKNVVGGAISIYSARPKRFFEGGITASYGNYDEKLVKGHITGPLGDSFAGRLAFQVRNRDGFNYDIAHGVDLDNVDSVQLRGQIAFEPVDSDFSAVLIADYTNDDSNGFHSLTVDGPAAGSGPWSAARAQVAALRPEGLSPRESLPDWQTYAGDVNPTPQQLHREAVGLTLNMAYDFDFATLTSITGYRSGNAFSVYDQTGIGPSNNYGIIVPLLFRSPVREAEDISQFTQELRLVSPEADGSGFDWILGGYFQHDEVSKDDIISFEIRVPVIPTLNGQSAWFNDGTNKSFAVFGQLGYRFNDMFRVVAGLRYSHDEKSGTVQGLALETGDRFTPNDPVPSSPLSPTYVEGGGYTTDYSNSWEELTPQVTAEFQPNPDILIYATYSTGFKGGGFEDDPANPAAAQSSYDPETVTNYEIGGKFEFFNNRARLNIAAFSMRYKDLQVTQTSDVCLCNITDNAADAKIRGIEAEAQVVPFPGFSLSGGLTLLDTKYIDFTDSVGNVNDGKFLQRTPHYQWNLGARYTTDIGSWSDGLSVSVNYNRQGKLSWNPEGSANEPAYGLLSGRISIKPTDDLTFSVWARNLTDELYRVNAIAFFGDEASRLGAPRTYGAEVSVRF